MKKKNYRVVVTETQSYDVKVTAKSKEEAEDIALEQYGCIGDIFSTTTAAVLVEEE